LDYELKITTENTKDYLKSIFKLINEKITEADDQNSKYFFTDKNENNEKNKIYNNFEIYYDKYKNNFLDKLKQFETEYSSKIENIFQGKINDANNIDKMMENEEELFFNTITKDLSNYYNSYDNFKKDNQLNDLLLYSQIYLNNYNRSYIDNDSIKTEFKFGWFFYIILKIK
jgi:hypothetical protein